MELKHDCVREVLICLEKVCLLKSDLSYSDTNLGTVCSMLPQYQKDDIFYTLVKLYEGGYIDMDYAMLPSGGVRHMQINSLTWSGHELLDSIRPEGVWSRIKDISSRAGGFSIKTMGYLGSLIVNNYISGLNLAEIAKECFK